MTSRIPPMQALRAFEATARTGSLTKAAEALSLTHGAISHQIKAIEAIVGVPLVERAGRGIRITDDGERLATRVRAAASSARSACMGGMRTVSAGRQNMKTAHMLYENRSIVRAASHS